LQSSIRLRFADENIVFIYLHSCACYVLHFLCLPDFITLLADHSGRTVWDMNCLRPLKHWDRGFESHSGHGSLCAFILCLCYPVYRKWPCGGLISRPRSPTDWIRLVNWKESQNLKKGL
jgi:hypothetical protein